MPRSASFFSMVPAIDVLLRGQLGCSKARHKPVRRRNALENAVFVSPIMGLLASAVMMPLRRTPVTPIFCDPGDTRRFAMPLPVSLRLLIAGATVAVLAQPGPSRAQGAAVSLASHRAV